MKRSLPPMMLAAMVVGCTPTLTPSAVAPGVPPAYPVAPRDASGPQASEIAWQEMFGDPRLRALIAAAFENNRDLRAATARIAEAAALRRIVRADRFPTLNAGASARASDGGSAGRGARSGLQPGGGVPGQDGAGGGAGEGGRIIQAEIGVSAFEVDFWGRVRNLDAAALAQYFATVEARDAFRLSLIADVAGTYLLGRELDLRARLARDTIGLRERGLYLAQRLRDEGEASDLEVSDERILLADARAALADVERQRAQADNLLQLLVGAPPTADLLPPLPLGAQGIVENVAPGLPSDLLLRRPDLREAEQGLRAAESSVAAARAALLPRIALTGATGFASSDLESLVSPGAVFWDLAADLLQPIFDAGRRRAQVAADNARLEIALATYERTIQTAFREVADALAARRFLAEQLVAQQAGLAAQTRRLRLAQLRFNAGEAAIVDLLEARRLVFQTQQGLATLRRAQLANAVELYIALGGADRRP